MSSFIRRSLTVRAVGLIVFEFVLIAAAVALAAYVRLGADDAWEMLAVDAELPKTLLIAGVCQLCLYFGDLYNVRVLSDRRELFVRTLQSLGAASLVLAVLYFTFPSLIIGRGVFSIAAGIAVTVIVGWRGVFEWAIRRVGPRERLLLVGTSEAAVRLARELYDRRDLGVEIVGFIDHDPTRVGERVLNPAIIGTIDDIPTIARSRAVDRIVVSLSDARGRLPMDKLLELKLEGTTFDHLPTVYEEYTGKIAIEDLRPSWLIFAPGFRKTRRLLFAKRLVDIATAGAGLFLLSPLMALVAAAVKLTSRGPVFYHQQRVGQHARAFAVHKFRSMRQDAEAETGAVWASVSDKRVTPVGSFLRRSRLDELPQLWNVLVGDMSFVGPRPERPEFVRTLKKEIPFYGQRHVVKPGITGWAQVRYTYGASVEDALEKLQYDLFYIKHMSIALDLFIVLKTIKTVVTQRGGQ